MPVKRLKTNLISPIKLLEGIETMPPKKTDRDYEYEYLSVSYQIEELLQKKTAAYSVQSEIEQLHHRLMELAKEAVTADDPRDREYDYLAAAYRIQELLQQKTASYALTHEFQAMQSQLDELGRKLNWGRQNSQGADSPFLTDRLSRLQSEIQDLRAAMV